MIIHRYTSNTKGTQIGKFNLFSRKILIGIVVVGIYYFCLQATLSGKKNYQCTFCAKNVLY